MWADERGASDTGGNLADTLAARAERVGFAARPAYAVGETVVSHGAVHENAARTAALLAKLGVRSGDRVLIALPDGLELVYAFLGAIRLGAMAVPVNPRLHVDDHRQMARDCRAMAVVCAAELAERFADRAVLIGETLVAQTAGLSPHPVAPVEPTAPAYAQFSSGTTGRPKAVLHAHRDALVYYQAFAEGAIALAPDDVVFSVSKMHFAYGLGNALFFPLLAGCRAVLHPDAPRPEALSALVARHRVSVMFAVPTFYAHLVSGGDARCWKSLRVAVSAGEPLTLALTRATRGFLGVPVLDGLGSTEVGQTFLSNTLAATRDGTVGRVLPPYQIEVRDGERRPLPPGIIGTLWVRGPTTALGYLDQPEASTAVRDGDWLCTGDRALVDPDGFAALHGRVDDLELVGGISVAPGEIEEVLATHAGVMEAAVAGVRDATGASRLEAFVVPAVGAGTTLAEELVSLTRARLAPYKVPRVVHLVDELPRTATGKLRRFVLRAGGWA